MAHTPKNIVTPNREVIPVSASIPYAVMQIHQGNGFSRSDLHEGLAAAGVHYHMIKTGANDIHIEQLVVETSGAPVRLEYYEDSVVSADGTPEPVGNNNRTSDKVSTTSFYHQPTITDVGNSIGATLIPSVTNQGGGVGILLGGEWILKPNTNYLIKLTNNDNAAIDYTFTLFFYEPDLR